MASRYKKLVRYPQNWALSSHSTITKYTITLHSSSKLRQCLNNTLLIGFGIRHARRRISS